MTTKEKALTILAGIVIALVGVVFYANWRSAPPREPASSADREGPGEVAESETASWKTYRNEDYGFEVKYPNDYDLKTFDNSIWISPMVADSFQDVYSVSFSNYEGTALAGITPKLYVDTLTATDSLILQRPITINNATGIDVELKSPKSRSVYFQNEPSKMINVQYFLENDKNYLDTGDQILSTFKFTK